MASRSTSSSTVSFQRELEEGEIDACDDLMEVDDNGFATSYVLSHGSKQVEVTQIETDSSTSWTPFSPNFLLHPNTYHNSKRSIGRFHGGSYLGRILQHHRNVLEIEKRPGFKLRNTILQYLNVHFQPDSADGTNVSLQMTLRSLKKGGETTLWELGAILEEVVQFHRKVHNLSGLVKSTTQFHSDTKLLGKRRYYDKSKALPEKLSAGKIPDGVVIAVVGTICKRSGASKLLGSRANIRHFLGFLKRIFLAGTSSRLHLSLLLEVLDSGHCPWLTGVADPALRMQVFAKMMLWLLCDYVYNILRLGYYVTESQATRFQLNFYLSDTWRSIISIVKRRMKEAGRMTLAEPSTRVTSSLRFIPKSDDLRPIVAALPSQKTSTHNMLQYQLLLRFLCRTIAPYCMFGSNDFFLRNAWQRFREDLEEMGHRNSKLYYLRVDIASAYPSVDVTKLTAILKDLVGKGDNVKKILLCAPKSKSEKRNKLTSVLTSEGADLTLLERYYHSFDSGIGDDERRARPFPAKTVLSRLLKLLTQRETVKVCRKRYTLNNGLPQGFTLSGLLCMIYFGHMERQYLSEYLQRKGEFFCRGMDDYLFVSPDKHRVAALYELLRPGIPEYNFRLKVEKTQTNVAESSAAEEEQGEDCVIFCGWRFRLRDGHVTRYYDAYAGLDPCSTISFFMGSVTNIEAFIVKRLSIILPLRLGFGVLDSWLNCKWQISVTVFDAALFMALRFLGMCRVLYPSLNSLDDSDKANAFLSGINAFTAKLYTRVTKLQSWRARPLEDGHCSCAANIEKLPTGGLEGNFNFFEIKYLVTKAFVLIMRRHCRNTRVGFMRMLVEQEDGVERTMRRRPIEFFLRTIVERGIPAYIGAIHR